MAKPKFTLTADLVNVEPEAIVASQPSTVSNVEIEQPQKKVIKYERLSLNIPKDLKKSFQLWCIQKGFNMTQALETAIKKIMDNT
jgi:hypothetical protein